MSAQEPALCTQVLTPPCPQALPALPRSSDLPEASCLSRNPLPCHSHSPPLGELLARPCEEQGVRSLP